MKLRQEHEEMLRRIADANSVGEFPTLMQLTTGLKKPDRLHAQALIRSLISSGHVVNVATSHRSATQLKIK